MLLGNDDDFGTHDGIDGVSVAKLYEQTDAGTDDTGTKTYDDGIVTDDGRNVGHDDSGVYETY